MPAPDLFVWKGKAYAWVRPEILQAGYKCCSRRWKLSHGLEDPRDRNQWKMPQSESLWSRQVEQGSSEQRPALHPGRAHRCIGNSRQITLAMPDFDHFGLAAVVHLLVPVDGSPYLVLSRILSWPFECICWCPAEVETRVDLSISSRACTVQK